MANKVDLRREKQQKTEKLAAEIFEIKAKITLSIARLFRPVALLNQK
ncbi:TPA: hypothetical protein ACYTJQ_001338 [Yersinia enterocolitica]|nr:hypothetical protein [Yersinia enterocolitica]HDZ9831788.1 hypothetical protein [Yersinia enterocolitica]HEC1639384.1 hypothetical protein [Yersinia enterocolitica]HEN3296358.1 hypothetical protein [Yersinia enterocolitica]HEN3349691.1 hypothetical protein [Yersinia enterocolitica]